MSASSQALALVTGGNRGIGFETCKGLIKAGFHVIVCARSKEKADAAVASLGDNAESLVFDLASLQSVRDAAQTFLDTNRQLQVLVLNAGIMALPWQTTVDGFEQQWQVNVLGHFLLRLCIIIRTAFGAGAVRYDKRRRFQIMLLPKYVG